MFQKSVDEIKKVLETQPIVAIDYALEALSSNTKETKQKDIIDSEMFDIFCKAIFKAKEINYGNNSNLVDRLFDKDLTRNQKHFIGICLLRLLNGSVNILDSTIKHKIIELFDEIFAEDLYSELGVKVKSQTYEKENALKDVVLNLEKEFNDLN